jgi:(+)-trans-carveol dehydrogenase
MPSLEGKIAVVSGAARGQGRSHAVALAGEGARVVAFDTCSEFPSARYPGSTPADLDETVRLVEQQGSHCIGVRADARDLPALRGLAERIRDEYGRLDILLVNHGIWTVAPNSWELDETAWQEAIDILLTGAWKVVAAFAPLMIEAGHGGSIVITGSTMSVSPQPSAVAYTAAKHGLVGLMRVLAMELGPHGIRVNMVSPGGVQTPLLTEGTTIEAAQRFQPGWWAHVKSRMMLPVGGQPAQSVSNAALWLAGDGSEYVTGANLMVDAGWTAS